jgi:hypothetical protein
MNNQIVNGFLISKPSFSVGPPLAESRRDKQDPQTYNLTKVFSKQNLFRGVIMKTKKIFFVSFFLICLIPVILSAQNIGVHKFIGKTKREVIKKYGNPAHQDNSDPNMMCMFYQTKTNRMIFVSDKSGVYQSEATANYDSEAKARSIVNDFITGSVADGFAVDTVSINDFQVYKTGVNADLQISENKITKNFDVNIKARRSED